MIEHQRQGHLFTPSCQNLLARRRNLAPRLWRRRESSAPLTLIGIALISAARGAITLRHAASAHRPAPRTEHRAQPLAEEIAVMLLHAAIGDQADLRIESLLERGAALRRVGWLRVFEPPQHLGKRLRA